MPAGLLILYDDLTMPTYKILIATKVREITHKNFILFRCTLRDVLYHGLPNHVLNGLQMLVKSVSRIAVSRNYQWRVLLLTCINVQISNHKSQRNTEFVCQPKRINNVETVAFKWTTWSYGINQYKWRVEGYRFQSMWSRFHWEMFQILCISFI